MSFPPAPPPLPPANPYAPPTVPVLPPTQQYRNQPLIDSILQGGRFVTVPYVISAVIITFRRSMGGVDFVKTGAWPMGDVISATLITCLIGWWGFPFGIIWSFISLFHLWNGGRDVTKQILISEVGPVEANRILSMSPKPKPPSLIWLVRAIILIPIGLIIAFFLMILIPRA